MHMNLKEFMQFVDHKAQELSQSQFQFLLHSIARKIPKEKREDFVMLLEDIVKAEIAEGSTKKQKIKERTIDETEMRKELSRLQTVFTQIAEAELYIEADCYQNYDRDYYDDWVWEYKDATAVCQAYEDACRLLKNCVDNGFYKEALELFDIMIETEITAGSEWDETYMGLEDLHREGLISVNLENIALYVLYASYQATTPEERAEALYSYFTISFFKEIHLEDMLCLGRDELEGVPQFWDSWIDLLIRTCSDTAGRLLQEAVVEQRGVAGLLDAARLGRENHPSLYLKLLYMFEQQHDSEEQWKIGKEALEKVGKKYIIRSEIALKTAEAVIELGREQEAEAYWKEAFVSHTTPINYLRLMVESKNREIYQETVKGIISSAKSNKKGLCPSAKELTENFVEHDTQNILRLFNGEFEFIIKLCQEQECEYYSPDTFMDFGVWVLLLLLLKGDNLKQNCAHIAEKVHDHLDFSAEDYFKGTKYVQEYGRNRTVYPKENEIFLQCFTRWKARFSITDKQATQYLLELEELVDKRVREIVSGQHREEYDDAAELAAALGEVKESRGEVSAKEAILQKYRKEFPRHSSFRVSLVQCGMSDIRK